MIFINQIREKVGVMFGSPETTPGGRALKFYCSCRIDVRRIGALKDGEEQVGQRVKAKIVKNKVAPPFRIAEFDMMHNNGISYEGDLLDLGTNHKVVSRSGSWFKYGETYLGQGKEKARNFLIENTDVAEQIKQGVMAAGGYAAPVESGSGRRETRPSRGASRRGNPQQLGFETALTTIPGCGRPDFEPPVSCWPDRPAAPGKTIDANRTHGPVGA